MSFVSVYAMENFITVMSDGLVYDTNTGKELEQNYEKFRKISPKQFIAFGGSRYMAETIADTIGYQESERNLMQLAYDTRDSLINHFSPEVGSCQLIIGGIEEDEVLFYSFNNDPKQEMLFKKPVGINPDYGFAYSSESGVDPVEEINRLYPYYKSKNPTSALKLQKALNDKMAEKDISVNRITFNKTFKK